MGAGLVAAQIEQCVAVAGHILPAVLEQLFELRHVLNDDVDGDFTAAAGCQHALKVLRQCDIGELVHQHAHRHGQSAAVLIVCGMVQFAERLRVHQTHKIVESGILIGNNGENDALAVAQCAERQVIAAGQVRHFFRVERRQSGGCRYQNGFCGFRSGLLEHLPVLHCDVILVHTL